MAEKRRLPVVQPKPENDDESAEPRPPWHWIGFGVVAVFAVWLPLAMLAEAIGLRVARARLGTALEDLRVLQARLAELPREDRTSIWMAILAPQVVALTVASLAGGYLVGRWGRGAGVREATIAGVAVALLAGMLSCSTGGEAWAALAICAISAPCAALGASRAARERQKKLGKRSAS
jgi:tRNA-(ms[2]io[6]A)-hydroxylase